MSDDMKPRQWAKGEVAPLDATREEWALHFLLWGDLLVEVPTDEDE